MRIQFNSIFLLFIVANIFDFSRVVSSYEEAEAEWQPVLYDYYHIDLGELGANQDQRASAGPPSSSSLNTPFSSVKIPTPKDAIINIINDLGIKLLATHNERNDNNIAISPYGAFSVLAALTEGLQGDSAHEILHAVRIPYDKQMIRVGLRDIHRHLKSYFIPEEGFLSGLSLNLNNVSLKNEYENVLKFYGFDYDSFNNARLPGDDSATTKKPGEMTTTLETGIGLSADPTMPSASKELEASSTTTTTMPKTTTTPQTTTSPVTTTTPITTTTPRTTAMTTAATTTESSKEETTSIKTDIPEVTETTSPPQELTTPEKNTALETTTTSTTLLPESESSQSQPPPSDTTIIETLEASGAAEEKIGDRYSTTVAKDSGNAQITSVTSTSNTQSENGITTTKYLQTTSNVFSTSSVDSETATSNLNTVTQKFSTDDVPDALSTMMIETEENTEKIVGSTKMIDSENTVRTTRDITISTITDVDDGPNTTVEQSNQITDEDTTATTSSVVNSETVNNDATISTISSLYEISTLDSTIPLAFTTAKDVKEAENEVKESTTTIADFDNNYNNNYDANNNLATSYEEEEREDNEKISSENPIMLSTTPKEVKPTNLFNVKRKVRSVVDYVIARIYEDRPRFLSPPPSPPRTHYLPEDSFTFAVYGKYREPGVNFMKYDTVLPYFFLSNLNAQALSFPLDSTKYYLLLLLPVRENGIDQLICDLRLYGNLRYIIGNLRLTHIVATIPSFMLKGYVTLTPTLQKLGIRRIFEPRQADFSPMTNNNSDIYVTNIEQAVTVTIRNYLDASATRYKNFQQYPAVTFKADHPFLYFVVDSELHVALMVGKVINPLNSRIS